MKSRNFLKKCELAAFPVREFSRVARGFADLGYEEFFLLDQGRLFSLHTGNTSTLTPEHEKFFFLVPEADYLADWFASSGFEIQAFEFKEQRIWELALRRAADSAHGAAPVVVTSASIEEALLDAVLSVSGAEIPSAMQRLKTIK